VQVTRQQLAQLMGISAGHIMRLVGEGMPAAVAAGGGRGRPALFDAVACLGWQREQLAAHVGNGSARDEYLRTLTLRAALDVAVRRGELVSQAQVDRDAAGVAVTVRARLRGVPAAIVTQVVRDQPERRAEVQGLMLGAIDEALRELARLGHGKGSENNDTGADSPTAAGRVLRGTQSRPRRRTR